MLNFVPFETYIGGTNYERNPIIRKYPANAAAAQYGQQTLAGRKREYRSIVVHKLFKLVYYVKGDTLHIAALWDTRREPDTQSATTK